MSLGGGQVKQIAVVFVASNPGVNDDSTAGYIIGSTVFSLASNGLYKCTDNTPGAAVWALVPFGSPITPAALTKADDTNVTLTLGGTPATALLQAVALTLGWTGQLSMARGGTGKNLTAANGAIPWVDADSFELLAPGSAGQPLLSGGAGSPTWGTAAPGVVDYSGSDSLVGFSSTTTHIFLYAYNPQAKTCTCVVSFSGTSDSVDLTTSLPFTSAAQNQTFAVGGVTNNGVTSLNPGRLSIAASGTTAIYTRDRQGTAWIASGAKVWYGAFTYLTA